MAASSYDAWAKADQSRTQPPPQHMASAFASDGDRRTEPHPHVVSVVNRFALVAAALNMASAAGIVPWAVADSDAAIIACMQRWLRQPGNIDAADELLREIWRRRQRFAATINDRFIHLCLKDRRLVPASAADQRKMEAEQRGDEQFERIHQGVGGGAADLGET